MIIVDTKITLNSGDVYTLDFKALIKGKKKKNTYIIGDYEVKLKIFLVHWLILSEVYKKL